jgi:hypothetical protein
MANDRFRRDGINLNFLLALLALLNNPADFPGAQADFEDRHAKADENLDPGIRRIINRPTSMEKLAGPIREQRSRDRNEPAQD